MGWKASMIVINSDKDIDDSYLLKIIGFPIAEKIEEEYLDSVINPEDGFVYIGKFKGNTIICTQELPLTFIDASVSKTERELTKLYPNTEIGGLILHSTVNLWGYSISRDNKKLRVRAGSSEDDFVLEVGEVLTEEKDLFDLSVIDETGERCFSFPDMPDERFDIHQVGENFVFKISERFFGESLDSSDSLLFETKFRGYRINSEDPSSVDTNSAAGFQILASKKVVDGSQINVLHKEKGIWYLIAKEDFSDEYQFTKEGLFNIEADYLYSRIPNLKGKLDQPNKTTINIDYRNGEININKQHLHIGIPTHSAKATRQADAGFNWLHYLSTTRLLYIKPIAIILALGISASLFGWFFYIPLVLYVAYQLLSISKTRDMFYSGALCPAIVIDAKQSKIAALTDLSLGSGSYPIIRIRKYPIPKKYLKNGQRIPVAGGYQNTENYSHWNYYEPLPLPTGIKDDDLIQSKISQIPNSEWLDLQRELKKFEKTPKEGYYPIKVEESSWSEMDTSQIKWMQFGEEK